MENEASQSLTLKVLVEKEKNQVVFVESNKDFVDVLFSFMVMPIGTITRLTREHSLRGDIGCLNNLYESVENLDEEFLRSQKCREILLHPRSAAEIYCRNLKLNLIESDSNEYYVCPSGECGLLSYYQTAHCRCGGALNFELKLSQKSIHQEGGVFVKPTTRFMISDDFQVKPMSTMTGLTLLMSKLGAMDVGNRIEERTVNIGRDELLKLLKCSLTSRTPFSDTFTSAPINKTRICHGKYGPRSMDQLLKFTDTAKKGKMISLKLIVNKSKNRALYAEVEEDFVDLLFSFLTFPLGYVFEGFPCLAFKGCINNLYKSVENIEAKLFESEEMKETLVSPKLAPGLAYNNQLIGIKEAINPSYDTLTSRFRATCSDRSSECDEEVKIGEGFIKGPSMFMVADNLTVMPLSPISGISLINKLQIPLSDIGEHEVTMGEIEALRLLVASLVSKCVLTDAFLIKESKQEK